MSTHQDARSAIPENPHRSTLAGDSPGVNRYRSSRGLTFRLLRRDAWPSRSLVVPAAPGLIERSIRTVVVGAKVRMTECYPGERWNDVNRRE